MLGKLVVGIVSSILIFIVGLVMVFPLTLCIMLFLGNLGLKISFWGSLPAALALGVLANSRSKTP